MSVTIGIPREIYPGERRVAASPHAVHRLHQLGFEVLIQSGAGLGADFGDQFYNEDGVRIVHRVDDLWAEADIVLKVRPPMLDADRAVHEADLIRPGGTFISFLSPTLDRLALDMMGARNATVLSMNCVPRITRAQKMDALSAMANVAGYRAAVEAAWAYPKFFGGQMTAAGTVVPAKVLVIGAGVAGLAAIGACRGLGAIVRAFDTRETVGEQVASMGAEFLKLDFREKGEGEGGYARVMSAAYIEAELALFAQQAMEVDIIITTAAIPGREAPKLITSGMVESMKEGSVVVDLAAETGGNCALTEPGETIVHHGVRVIGATDFPSRMAPLSSRLYGTTLVNLLEEMGGAEGFSIDYDNEVVRGALILHEGEMRWPPPQPDAPEVSGVSTPPGAPTMDKTLDLTVPEPKRRPWAAVGGLIAVAALLGIGSTAPDSFIAHFTVFVLACFVGWQVVWNVSPALHTPLMSVTNAISGIIIIGGLLQISGAPTAATTLLGAGAIFLASLNVAGGFLVTRRMLAMFHR